MPKIKPSFDDFEAFPFTKWSFPFKKPRKNTQKKQPSSGQKEILKIWGAFVRELSSAKVACCKPFVMLDFHNERSRATFPKMSR